jgi:hypothetical protein
MPKHHIVCLANPDPDALLQRIVDIAYEDGATVTQFLYDTRTNLANVTIETPADLSPGEAQELLNKLPRYARTNLSEYDIPPPRGGNVAPPEATS